MYNKKYVLIVLMMALGLSAWNVMKADDPFIIDDPVEPGTFDLTVTSADGSKGTVTGTGSYAHGSLVTISATAKTGYQFDEWSDGVCANPRQVELLTDSTITAAFVAVGDLHVCPGDNELVIYNNPYKGSIVFKNASTSSTVATYDRDCEGQTISYSAWAAGSYIVEFGGGERKFIVTKE